MTTTINTLTVDYTSTMTEMIDGQKWYVERSSSFFAALFPISGNGLVEVEYKLFHFNDYTYTDSFSASREMRVAGYQPAKIEYLLAFGEKNPEEQLTNHILGLGSFAQTEDGVLTPMLSKYQSHRALRLTPLVQSFGSLDVRFLGVR